MGAASLLPSFCMFSFANTLSPPLHLNLPRQITWCGICFHAWSLTDKAFLLVLLSDLFMFAQLFSKRYLNHHLCQPQTASLIFAGINSGKWAMGQHKNLQWSDHLSVGPPQVLTARALWMVERTMRPDIPYSFQTLHSLITQIENTLDSNWCLLWKDSCVCLSHTERWTSGCALIFPY